MLRRLIGEDIDLVFQGQSSNLWIMADAGMMEQVIMNLCVNARDAMPNGGTLAIGTRQVEISAERAQETLQAYPGVFTCLSVADSGCGMTDETLKHVFEPFFTTKEVGKGTGLGLATVYGIVNQHHGWIEVDSALGKGTTFRVFLPALPRPAQARSDSRNAQVRGGTETILLVEDDPGLRRQASLGLRKLGYTILEAASGADALRLWEQEHGRIALLFTDMVMPGGLTGLGLADRLMTQKPTLKTLVTSGYSVEKTKPELLAAKGINYLAKPYEASALANAVRVCLDQPHRPRADIH